MNWKDPEQVREYHRRWREANPEYYREYYAQNFDKLLNYQRKRRDEALEAHRQSVRANAKRQHRLAKVNAEKRRKRQKSESRRRKLEWKREYYAKHRARLRVENRVRAAQRNGSITGPGWDVKRREAELEARARRERRVLREENDLKKRLIKRVISLLRRELKLKRRRAQKIRIKLRRKARHRFRLDTDPAYREQYREKRRRVNFKKKLRKNRSVTIG